MTKRPAIAMIELIFAIVVMGIALMAIPNLIFTTQKSSYVAIQQEAINEGATHLVNVLSYPWDENDTNISFLEPILHVSNGDSDLDEYNNEKRRIGTPKKSYRKFIRADGREFNASSLGLDEGESISDSDTLDDIDDFNGQIYHLVLEEFSQEDYVEREENVSITTSVDYISDTPGSGSYSNPGGDKKITFNLNPTATTPTTNIKVITVNVSSASGVSELEKNVTLRAFSCNIGATWLEEKEF